MPKIVYQNKSIFFIHIPKTGGTSLYANLRRQGALVEDYNPYVPVYENVTNHHLDHSQLKKYYIEIKNSFTIIRNPWDRTLSEYVYKTKDPTFKKLNNWLLVHLTLYNKNPCIKDNHFKPMNKFINKDTVIFDFKNLSKMHSWICEKLNNKFDFSIVKNQSVPYTHVSINDVLETNVADLWYDLYSEDIDLYKFLTEENKVI